MKKVNYSFSNKKKYCNVTNHFIFTWKSHKFNVNN